MALIADLSPFVLPYVQNCADSIARFHMRNAAIEFMRRTLIWRKKLAPVRAVQGALAFTVPLVNATSGTLTAAWQGETRNDYIVTFSDGSIQLASLTFNGVAASWAIPVTAGADASIYQRTYSFPTTTDAKIEKFLRFEIEDREARVVTPDAGEEKILRRSLTGDCAWTQDRVSFSVHPAPYSLTTAYICTVALRPTQDALTLDDEVFDAHAEDIATGALARLFAINKQAWTDLTQAAARRAMFEHRIGVVAAQAGKGFGRGRMRVHGRYY